MLPVNDAPVIAVGGPVGYVHDAPRVLLAPIGAVGDIDSDDFDTGRLRVRVTAGVSDSNRLGIASDGVTLEDNEDVVVQGVIIGKRVSNGFGDNDLTVRFNNNATPFRVQQLVRAITFKTVGGAAGPREVTFDVKDGDVGLSAEATKTVNVS